MVLSTWWASRSPSISLRHDLDVSLPRRERKAGRGHRAFVIDGDPSMSTVKPRVAAISLLTQFAIR